MAAVGGDPTNLVLTLHWPPTYVKNKIASSKKRKINCNFSIDYKT